MAFLGIGCRARGVAAVLSGLLELLLDGGEDREMVVEGGGDTDWFGRKIVEHGGS